MRSVLNSIRRFFGKLFGLRGYRTNMETSDGSWLSSGVKSCLSWVTRPRRIAPPRLSGRRLAFVTKQMENTHHTIDPRARWTA